MTHRIERDGYIRIVHADSVIWYIDNNKANSEFVIARFPFVPDYHLCDFVDYEDDIDSGGVCERPLQQFTTLTQALAVLKVIEGSQS
jgi:hypothetical protein